MSFVLDPYLKKEGRVDTGLLQRSCCSTTEVLRKCKTREHGGLTTLTTCGQPHRIMAWHLMDNAEDKPQQKAKRAFTESRYPWIQSPLAVLRHVFFLWLLHEGDRLHDVPFIANHF